MLFWWLNSLFLFRDRCLLARFKYCSSFSTDKNTVQLAYLSLLYCIVYDSSWFQSSTCRYLSWCQAACYRWPQREDREVLRFQREWKTWQTLWTQVSFSLFLQFNFYFCLISLLLKQRKGFVPQVIMLVHIMHVHNLHDLEYIKEVVVIKMKPRELNDSWIQQSVFSECNIHLEMQIGLFCF